jgi:hypothetical protein
VAFSSAWRVKNSFTKVSVFAKNSETFARFPISASSIPDGIF